VQLKTRSAINRETLAAGAEWPRHPEGTKTLSWLLSPVRGSMAQVAGMAMKQRRGDWREPTCGRLGPGNAYYRSRQV